MQTDSLFEMIANFDDLKIIKEGKRFHVASGIHSVSSDNLEEALQALYYMVNPAKHDEASS